MAIPEKAVSPVLSPRDRIIVALDVATAGEAEALVAELGSHVGAFKIGLQLFTSEGPRFVEKLVATGMRIFLDLKFHDIPNTVAKAAVEASKLGVWMMNVHAVGGREMMIRTVQEVVSSCKKDAREKPLIIGVTVLTSTDQAILEETGIPAEVNAQVRRLARLAFESGLDGVVASPKEVAHVRREVPNPTFLTVTPGIRAKHATKDDQRRVTTFGQALAGGSDYVVIGRPITQAADRVRAVSEIIGDI